MRRSRFYTSTARPKRSIRWQAITPSILHYRALTRDIARLAMEQFPLGLTPGGRYSSQRVSYSPQDLFLMISDGSRKYFA